MTRSRITIESPDGIESSIRQVAIIDDDTHLYYVNSSRSQEPQRSQCSSHNQWPWITFLLVISYMALALPSLTWRAEVHAESAWKYFACAYHHDWLTNFLEKDRGYFPWLQRLVSVVGVRVFGIVKHWPLFSQGAAALFIAGVAAVINLRAFRIIIADDLVRFMTSLAIGFGLTADYQCYAFMNFPYFAAPLLVLAAALDKEKMRMSAFVPLMLFNVLVVLSKGFFAAYGPLFVVLAIHAFRTGQRKSMAYFAVGAMAALCQLLSMSATPMPEDLANVRGLSYVLWQPWEFARELSALFVHTHASILFKHGALRPATLEGFLVLIGVGVALAALWKSGQQRAFWCVVYCNAVAIFSMAIYLIALSETEYSFEAFVPVPFNRYTIVFTSVILLGVFVSLGALIRDRACRAGAAFLLAASFAVFRPTVHDTVVREDSHSQWGCFCRVLAYDDYCVPINPYPLTMQRNCRDILHCPLLDEGPAAHIDIGKYQPPGEAWQIRAFMYEQDEPQRRSARPRVVTARDAKGEILAKAMSLTPAHYKYQYYCFESRITPTRLEFTSVEGAPLPIDGRDFRFFGQSAGLVVKTCTQPRTTAAGSILPGSGVRQAIIARHDELFALTLTFGVYERTNHCKVRLRLLDEETGEALVERTLDAAMLIDNTAHTIRFEPIQGIKDRRLTLVIESPDATPADSVTVWLAPANAEDGDCSLGTDQKKKLTVAYQCFYFKRD